MFNESAKWHKSRMSHFTRRLLAVSISVTLSAGVASISVVDASISPKSDSCVTANGIKVTDAVVCKGLTFYKGQTVTFVAPTSAGSAYDIYSRAFAKELSAYLDANVVVENVNGANGIVGMDQLAGSNPNGLTIGYYNVSAEFGDLATNAPGVNFNIRDIVVLGAEENGELVLATLPSSPYASFAALKQDDSATNPVKIVTNIGSLSMGVSLTMREFGLPYSLLTGYVGTAASTTGFIRGDGPLVGTGFATLESYIVAGTVKVLALETQALKLPRNQPMASTVLAKIPTDGTLDKIYPPKTEGEKTAAKYLTLANLALNYVPGAPSAMPSYLIMTMRDAYKWAAATSYVKDQITQQGNTPLFLKPSAVKASILRIIALAPKIGNFLGY